MRNSRQHIRQLVHMLHYTMGCNVLQDIFWRQFGYRELVRLWAGRNTRPNVGVASGATTKTPDRRARN